MTSNYSRNVFLFLLIIKLYFHKTIQTDDTASKLQVIMMPLDWPVDNELKDDIRAATPSKSCTQNIKAKGLYMTLWLHRNDQVISESSKSYGQYTTNKYLFKNILYLTKNKWRHWTKAFYDLLL